MDTDLDIMLEIFHSLRSHYTGVKPTREELDDLLTLYDEIVKIDPEYSFLLEDMALIKGHPIGPRV